MQVKIETAAAERALKAAAETLFAPQALEAAARGLENAWREYYRRRGGVFWPRLGNGGEGKAWTQRTTGTRAEVAVEGEWGAILAHKITGGVIEAKRAANLAIPANAKARKKGSPRDFGSPKLKVIRFGRNGPLALVKDDGKKGKKTKKRAKPGQGKPRNPPEVWYWLKPSVMQKPDPGALPPMEELGAAVEKAVGDFYRKLGGGSGGH